jgi:hypothetical protein
MLMQVLQQGRILEAVMGVWLSSMGTIAVPLTWFLFMIPVYIKTRSVFVVAALTLLFSGFIMAMLPVEFHKVAYVMIALTFGAVLAKLFIRW